MTEKRQKDGTTAADRRALENNESDEELTRRQHANSSPIERDARRLKLPILTSLLNRFRTRDGEDI